MSSANNGAINAAHVASRKRKFTGPNQAESSSKKVVLELFPTHPTQKPPSHVSQSTADHDTNGGQNRISSSHRNQSFTSLLNSGHYTNHDDTYLLSSEQLRSEEQEDPLEKLFKSQYETMRETCKQYFNSKYNDLLRQVEERTSGIRKDKDMEMAHMRSMITHLEEKLPSDSAHIEQLNEVINKRNTELDNTRRRHKELEEQVVHSKSQAELWKEKAGTTEEMLWNMSSPRQAPCYEVEEGTSFSSVGGR
ncbi:hypothetical protein POM88_042295 [Heracleum sosnowskyi]|uniref:Uncharacterized protein n=1 Tax=Heracleum sosnowskyi TaxID=360622 RepID=A0AAD8HHY0_9APIA|nr:hypothetical protein POM88_042295 [Heracleum sosnowskyi]